MIARGEGARALTGLAVVVTFRPGQAAPPCGKPLRLRYQPMASGSQVAICGYWNKNTSAISCNTMKGITPL